MDKIPLKKCLVISYGPVPTPDNQTVEGGGMRAWGLATGLRDNGVSVTVGINSGFPQKIKEHEGIQLKNWSLDNEFIGLMNSFDAVIVSYCMGDPSVFIAENIDDNVQLILDAYVPIYIEVSARDSKDIDTEYKNYMADIARHNKTLLRGDYFLYANDAQELLYSGVLSALGIINPASYREKRLIKTPFGINRASAIPTINPYEGLGLVPSDFVVLWFGGIYPWFRIEEYLDAISELSKNKQYKFVFVGGKNPFNPNPDFSRQYDATVNFARKNKIINKQVFFVDWVDFDTRINWFRHADVVVSLNQPGNENKFSWRTRVMDYIWGDAVTITNGGDPLSDELVDNGAALKIDKLDSEELVSAIERTRTESELLAKTKKAITVLKEKYFWDNVTTEIADIVKKHELPYANEASLRGIATSHLATLPQTGSQKNQSKVARLIGMPIRLARQVKKKGLIRTSKLMISVVANLIRRNTTVEGRKPQFIFISHPIDNTGAPMVLMQFLDEYVDKYGSNRIRVITPGVLSDSQAMKLKKLGIKHEHAVFGIGFRAIRLQLNLRPDDFVFMNTVAIHDNYRDFIMLWLKNGRLKHAYWFIHEDIAQLPVIHPSFLDKPNTSRISKLENKKLLTLFFPSKRTATEYKKLIDIKHEKVINLRVEVPKRYCQQKNEKDFDSINFLLSGMSSDGRKGQLLALSAFQHFIDYYYSRNPKQYRDFTLNLVAITKADYISQQIRWIGSSMLGDKIKIFPPLARESALKIASRCNAVICASLNETFGLYIAEGMLMGHIVLRNNCAGVDEQLKDGVNGLLFNHKDIKDFAEKIEMILNKKYYSNTDAVRMSRASQEIINSYTSNTYIEQISK